MSTNLEFIIIYMLAETGRVRLFEIYVKSNSTFNDLFTTLETMTENKQISIYDENDNIVSPTNAKFGAYIKYYNEDI